MGSHANLPYHLYVHVSNAALGPAMPPGYTRAIWHAVYARPGQLLLAQCLLETGAHWCGIPLHMISTSSGFGASAPEREPWGAMGERVQAIHAHYLEGLPVTMRSTRDLGRHTGIVIDYEDGFSRYPHEHKPLNLVNLDNGQFALLPNNYLLFADKHFTGDAKSASLAYYRRGETVYWEHR